MFERVTVASMSERATRPVPDTFDFDADKHLRIHAATERFYERIAAAQKQFADRDISKLVSRKPLTRDEARLVLEAGVFERLNPDDGDMGIVRLVHRDEPIF